MFTTAYRKVLILLRFYVKPGILMIMIVLYFNTELSKLGDLYGNDYQLD